MTEAATPSPVDVLFVSESALWPQDQGCKIHGAQMALAAARLGIRVGVACMQPTPIDATPDLRRLILPWPDESAESIRQFKSNWRGPGAIMRKKIASHQGLEISRLAGVIDLVRQHRPSVVIGVGLHSVMMLRGLPSTRKVRSTPEISTLSSTDSRQEKYEHRINAPQRVWYAADELVFFNLSCLRREPLRLFRFRMRTLALHTALEQFFARGLDGAIGVSPLDTLLLKEITGVKNAVTIRNGVDLNYFQPASVPPYRHPAQPHSLSFWGRMDFEPNVDAVTWFVRSVWPSLRQRFPDATLRIAGKNPTPGVTALASVPGVSVIGEVTDIRELAFDSAVTVLPMRCGGGIKNKLLEAAAMGLPIVASPVAVRGLDFGAEFAPVIVCNKPREWFAAIAGLWSDTERAIWLGESARKWVEAHHHWNHAARQLLTWVDRLRADSDLKLSGETLASKLPKEFPPRQKHAA
ncbi:MAG: glycosyltransferase [Phycisphaeraceae bacterium]|nr:glycosyltransferase [Phycisphaeraceae bacterium]